MSKLWYWVNLSGEVSKEIVPLAEVYAFIYKDVRPSVSLSSTASERKRILKRNGGKVPSSQPQPSKPKLDKKNEEDDESLNLKMKTKPVASTNPSNTGGLKKIAPVVETHREGPAGGGFKAIWDGKVSKHGIMNWLNEPSMLNILSEVKKKVKVQGTVTVFLSSPFDGLEDERSIFREKYAPGLENLCASKGVILKFVDMRFGITSEQTSQNETVTTCLRGLDDSEIFLGFFGARYGSSTMLRGNPLCEGILKSMSVTDAIIFEVNTTFNSSIVTKTSNRVFLALGEEEDIKSGKDYTLEFEVDKEFFSENCETNTIKIKRIDQQSLPSDTSGLSFCLREGTGDWILQDMEKAKQFYPDISDLGDRAVTEIEFQRGMFMDCSRQIICSGKTRDMSKDGASVIKSMGKRFTNMFTNNSKIEIMPSTISHQIALDDQTQPFAVRLGMRLEFEAYPGQYQFIIAWDEEKKSCTVIPGIDGPISADMPYNITIPKRISMTFFRSPSYDDSMAEEHPEQRKRFQIENEASRIAREKLIDKCRSISSCSESAICENYETPAVASEMMSNVLKFILPKVLPGEKAVSFQRSNLVHESYAKVRTLMPLVGRDKAIQLILSHLCENRRSSSGKVYVVGEEGCGKSSVLAQFCLNDISGIDNDKIHRVYHFCGCNPSCGDLSKMVERIIRICDAIMHFSVEEHQYLSNLSTQKRLSWLFDFIQNREDLRFMFIIDGLDRIAPEYYDGSSYLPENLMWLPSILPPNISLVVSCDKNGVYEKKIRKMSNGDDAFHEISLDIFSDEETKKCTESVLHFNHKNLSDMYEGIYTSGPCRNPLHLNLLLNELVTVGTWGTLGNVLNDLLSASNTSLLIEKIFVRLENLLDVDTTTNTHMNFVGCCLAFIWCSRKGLTESEILELINIDLKYHQEKTIKASQRQWLSLQYGLHHLMSENNGLYNVDQTNVRIAVKDRYIRDSEQIRSLHLRLANYFKVKASYSGESNVSEDINSIPRVLREMDYHYNQAGVTPPVTLAVRVRPFLKQDSNSGGNVSLIKMKGKQVMLTEPITSQPYCFTADYALWSCYNDTQTGEGPTRPVSTNETIWKQIGANVLDQAIGSFDVSVFAYGQTGSGKTFTMFGNDEEPGLIYLICRELFRQLNGQKAQMGINFAVTISLVEVYNEKLRDLLDYEEKTKQCAIRPLYEDAEGHPFIPNLVATDVTNWEDVQTVIKDAYDRRATNGTMMNAESSRSHCVFILKMTRSIPDTDYTTSSKINLVDLAGSESGKTRQAMDPSKSKQILQEGIKINRSLSALNKCIRSLAEKSSHIPFRDSKLTHLLKDSLSGNGKLILLATVSPDEKSFSETLSTLNYGKMAKLIEYEISAVAENRFLEEIAKQTANNVILEAGDKIALMVPKSCAERTDRGSYMLADMTENTNVNNLRVPVARVEGKILEIAVNYLRHVFTSLQNSNDEQIEEWELTEYIPKIENVASRSNDAITFMINCMIVAIDLSVPKLQLIFKNLLGKLIMRDPTIDVDKFFKDQTGMSPSSRLDDSQKRIEKYKGMKVTLSGGRGRFGNIDGYLEAGEGLTIWKAINVSHGKIAFLDEEAGKYITAYGTGDAFKKYLRPKMYKIALKISSDIVDDIIEETSHAKDDCEEDKLGFNYSGLMVEKGKSGSNEPEINQLFEIHGSASSYSVMINNCFGTCWRSPGWSKTVMYSTYELGRALGDEQMGISVYSSDGDADDDGDY